jgi:hypothetical protein
MASAWRPLALPAYRLWMGLAWVLGTLNSWVLLGLFYYVVLTPLGWLLGLAGDPMQRRPPTEPSLWMDVPENGTRERMRRLF